MGALSRPNPIRAGLAACLVGLTLCGCAAVQQVRWSTYSPQVRPAVDEAAALQDCRYLNQLLAYAKETSDAHEKATGISNAALEEYIRSAIRRSGCA